MIGLGMTSDLMKKQALEKHEQDKAKQIRRDTLLEVAKRTQTWIENIELGPYKPYDYKNGVIKGLSLVLEGINEKLAEGE